MKGRLFVRMIRGPTYLWLCSRSVLLHHLRPSAWCLYISYWRFSVTHLKTESSRILSISVASVRDPAGWEAPNLAERGRMRSFDTSQIASLRTILSFQLRLWHARGPGRSLRTSGAWRIAGAKHGPSETLNRTNTGPNKRHSDPAAGYVTVKVTDLAGVSFIVSFHHDGSKAPSWTSS